MRTLYITFLLLLATLFNANAQTSTKDLGIFLGKLQKYVATHNIYDKPSMPIAKPDGPPANMPSPDVSGYMVDPVTGLRYYSKFDKIVDPVTRYSFHIGTGKIVLEPIKEKDTASNK
ncbi:hypothetical protein ACFS7Z_18175 [Pontibacter toksunensis]|uniref:Uncharacterized protein n=1 Tax=Pontibacter toksunensis TaxID=1332631 RepID=A0ABW6BZ78_9BACT